MSINGWQLLAPALARGARFTRACIRIDNEYGEIDNNELKAWLKWMTFHDDHRDPDWPADSVPIGMAFAFVVWDDNGVMWSSGSDNGVAELRETAATPAAWLRAMSANPLGLKEIGGGPELNDLDLGHGDSEIPEQYRWNSDDENVTDKQRGAAVDIDLADTILNDVKSWQLSLPSGNPALDIRIGNLPPVVVKRLREIADTHIAVALSFTDDTGKP